MFAKTRLKLTVFYSLLFLVLFWTFSFGIYFWMERSFGEDYISRVQKRQNSVSQSNVDLDDQKQGIATIAGDVALDQLLNILLAINGLSIFIIPIISWYLAKKTLTPIQIVHEKQKQFVSDASHELRTPLSIMTGEIEVALRKDRPKEEYKHILSSNKDELLRLTSLVENLLFLAKDDQHNAVSLSENVDLTDLLATIIVQLKPVYSKKHLTVQFEPSTESVVVKGNTMLLSQLFFNLIDNAIKYTDKGNIRIRLSKDDMSARISIKDTGIGISIEHQSRLFDRFYRVDSARSQTNGYGLGLAICQTIITRHKGNISLKSQPAKGTTVTVELPMTAH